MGKNLDKNVILGKIKQFYGFKTNKELASFLGVANNTITNWMRRNTIDYDLIFTKCTDIDINWLLSNEKDPQHAKIEIFDVEFSERTIEEIINTYVSKDALHNLFTYLIAHFNKEEEYAKNSQVYFKLNYIVTVLSQYIPENQFKDTYEMYKSLNSKKFLYEKFEDQLKQMTFIADKLSIFCNEIDEMFAFTKIIAKEINLDHNV